MWCTFASQQLKLKRQLFISYHLFSAICPPLSGMLPGNISPGFDITYFSITANRSSRNEPLLTEGGGGKIGVLIWIWMKRQINKWPPKLVLKYERLRRWKKDEWCTGAHVSLNLLLLLSPCVSFHLHLTSASCFPTMVSSSCSVCHLAPLQIHFLTTTKALKSEKCCVPMCPCNNVYICRGAVMSLHVNIMAWIFPGWISNLLVTLLWAYVRSRLVHDH